MKGHPKYKVGDNVSFTINNEIQYGYQSHPFSNSQRLRAARKI